MADRRQCRNCLLHVPNHLAFNAQRSGGGSYKRGVRTYQSTICLDCAVAIAGGRAVPDHAMQKRNGWSVRRMIEIRDNWSKK